MEAIQDDLNHFLYKLYTFQKDIRLRHTDMWDFEEEINFEETEKTWSCAHSCESTCSQLHGHVKPRVF